MGPGWGVAKNPQKLLNACETEGRYPMATDQPGIIKHSAFSPSLSLPPDSGGARAATQAGKECGQGKKESKQGHSCPLLVCGISGRPDLQEKESFELKERLMFVFMLNWTFEGLKIIYFLFLFYFILFYYFILLFYLILSYLILSYFMCLEKLWDISEISSRVGLTEQSEGSS